jgi:amino acid transporter
LKKSLAFWPLVATILCCVSGGPFGLEPVVQSGVGVAILLVVLTPIVWSVPAALMTAELSSALPQEGGYYVWVRRAMGPFWGFLCAWWSWVYSWIDVAIYPVLFVTYGERFLTLAGYAPAFEGHPWLRWAIGMGMILPLTLVNIRGIKMVGASSVLFFLLILAPFAVLFLLGIPRWAAHPLPAPFVAPGKTASAAFTAGLFVAMWNYLGWDTLTTVAGEVKDPKRAYPRALAFCVPAVALIYLLPLLAGVHFLPDISRWQVGAWSDVAQAAGGRWLALATAGAGLVSSAALFSSTLLAGSRIPFAVAEDRILPDVLTRLHPRYGTPWVAILVSTFFYSLFSFASFKSLADADVMVYSAGLALEFAALVILRFREPDLPRPFRIPGGWPAVVMIVLLPAAILAAAINDQLHGDSALLLKLVTPIALATGPLVWWLSRIVIRRQT